MKTISKLLYLSFIIASALVIGSWSSAQAAQMQKVTIVLVHGAFADGSSWNRVIRILQAKDYNVVAVQNPLTSLADDAANVKRVLDNQTDPVLLVGHSWGGAVITEAGLHEKVKALVYIAAFAPDARESAFDSASRFAPAIGFREIKTDPSGFASLTLYGIQNYFAPDLSKIESHVMFATQGTTWAGCFEEKVTHAAWKSKPTTYIIANKDNIINPDAQRYFADKMAAKTVTLDANHVVFMSWPKTVAKILMEAAERIE